MGSSESKLAGDSSSSSLVGRQFTLRNKSTCLVDRVLAQGGFSTVYAAATTAGGEGGGQGRRLAIKQVVISQPEAEMEAMNEIRAHKLLSNNNNNNNGDSSSEFVSELIEVQVIASSAKQQQQPIQQSALEGRSSTTGKGKEILLFFPLYHLGSLGDALVRENKSPPAHYLLQCARAVEFIHARDLVHGDIKTINFMLLAGDKVVLIDFGSSRHVMSTATGGGGLLEITSKTQALDEQERAERMSSAAYRAPELWDVRFSSTPALVLDLKASDVFALGCVFYACLYAPFGFTPFEHPIQGLLPLAARTASVPRFATVTNPSAAAASTSAAPVTLTRMDGLVCKMLDKDAAQRPTASQVVAELVDIQSDDFDAEF